MRNEFRLENINFYEIKNPDQNIERDFIYLKSFGKYLYIIPLYAIP